MITDKATLLLTKNWGEKADAMDCYCEVKFIDVFSRWECYIFALNPEDENGIQCIVKHKDDVEIVEWSLDELNRHYNTEGEYPTLDNEFRRIKADVLYKRLKIDG